MDAPLTITHDGIRQFLIDNLNKTQTYTDQVYEGSNLYALVDLNAAFTNLMLYYLNQTAVGGQFSETNIYENMNKIVRILDYKPMGYQTCLCNARLFFKNVPRGTYTIPRYSYVDLNNIRYSFSEDVTVYKTTDNTLEEFVEVSKNLLLHNGSFLEYTPVVARGIKGEKITLTVDERFVVDHFNVHVYVNDQRWNSCPGLNFENGEAERYEIRLNEYLLYEITFGDGINGRKLSAGDVVQIYYLRSDGTGGEIAQGLMNGKAIRLFNTPSHTRILNAHRTNQNYITNGNVVALQNDCSSTTFKTYENIQEIRENAPRSFRGQYKIVQAQEYKNFIRSNFNNLIDDVSVFNNADFLQMYNEHYTRMGLTDIFREHRVLQNQLLFGNSCNFNNVYACVIPRNIHNGTYLSNSFKTLIHNSLDAQKCATANVVVCDPIYLDIFLATEDSTRSDDCHVRIVTRGRSNSSSIKTEVRNIFKKYLLRDVYKFGDVLRLQDITNDILQINDVLRVETVNDTKNSYKNGVSFGYADTQYPEIVADVLRNNTTWNNIFCWKLFDTLDKLVDDLEVV